MEKGGRRHIQRDGKGIIRKDICKSRIISVGVSTVGDCT
jgi:hypothetical protein